MSVSVLCQLSRSSGAGRSSPSTLTKAYPATLVTTLPVLPSGNCTFISLRMPPPSRFLYAQELTCVLASTKLQENLRSKSEHMKFPNVKAGEQVWHACSSLSKVVTVTRTTKTQIIVGTIRFARKTGKRIGYGPGRIEPLTDQPQRVVRADAYSKLRKTLRAEADAMGRQIQSMVPRSTGAWISADDLKHANRRTSVLSQLKEAVDSVLAEYSRASIQLAASALSEAFAVEPDEGWEAWLCTNLSELRETVDSATVCRSAATAEAPYTFKSGRQYMDAVLNLTRVSGDCWDFFNA